MSLVPKLNSKDPYQPAQAEQGQLYSSLFSTVSTSSVKGNNGPDTTQMRSLIWTFVVRISNFGAFVALRIIVNPPSHNTFVPRQKKRDLETRSKLKDPDTDASSFTGHSLFIDIHYIDIVYNAGFFCVLFMI